MDLNRHDLLLSSAGVAAALASATPASAQNYPKPAAPGLEAAPQPGTADIIMDGGIRRGRDVFQALALGADLTAIGRPVLYGMALGGAQGVQAVYARLKTELQMVMQLAGTVNIKSITKDYVSRL